MKKINYSIRINPIIIPKKEHIEPKTITLNTNNNLILFNNKQLFDNKIERIFNQDSTQEEIYDYIKPIINSTLNNINSTVLIFGERKSGKSYTMFGEDWCLDNTDKNFFQNNSFNKENIGIVPRYINQLINNINEDIKISCNNIMIFNENVYDLLNDNINNLSQIDNLIYFDCNDINDFFIILKKRKNNILKKLNEYPEIDGKYHNIFTIHYENLKTKISSKTNFCVLGDGYFESTNDIDIKDYSLIYLRKFINSIQNKQDFNEFEKSILTNYLKDSIGEKYETYIIVQIINYSNKNFNLVNSDKNNETEKINNNLDNTNETNRRWVIKKNNDNISYEDKKIQIGLFEDDDNLLLLKNPSHTGVGGDKKEIKKKLKKKKRNKKYKENKEESQNLNKTNKDNISPKKKMDNIDIKLKDELFPFINQKNYEQNITKQFDNKDEFLNSFYSKNNSKSNIKKKKLLILIKCIMNI